MAMRSLSIRQIILVHFSFTQKNRHDLHRGVFLSTHPQPLSLPLRGVGGESGKDVSSNCVYAMLSSVMKKGFLCAGIVFGCLLLGAGCATSNKQLSGDQLFAGQTSDDGVAPSVINTGTQIQTGPVNQGQVGPQ